MNDMFVISYVMPRTGGQVRRRCAPCPKAWCAVMVDYDQKIRLRMKISMMAAIPITRVMAVWVL